MLASRSVTLYRGRSFSANLIMYVKLFGSILDSSIWSTDLATRVVWITMLTMADEYGIVYASVDGLANRARISLPECRRALRLLLAGDRNSRTKNDRGTKLEGRRVEAVEGGWQVINYKKYRELRSRKQLADAARQARHRAKSVTARDASVTSVTSHDVTVEAEAEADKRTTKTPERVTSHGALPPKTTAPHGAGRDLKQPTTTTAGHATWLTPFGLAWQQHCGERVPWKPLAQQLAPLCKKYDSVQVLNAFRNYLTKIEPRYASPARFAATSAQWGLGNGGRPTGPHYPTADEADRAAGIKP